MADISNNTYWSETDANNNSASPNGYQTGQMLPSQVEPVGQMGMGAIKRFWDRINATITTTGSSGAYNYATANTSYPSAYQQGEKFTFTAHQSNVGNDTFQVNSLSALNIYKVNSSGISQIIGGDIVHYQLCEVMYSATAGGSGVAGFVLLNPAVSGSNPSALVLSGTVAPALAAGNLGLYGAGSAPTMTASAEGAGYVSSANGLVLQGFGTTYDMAFANRSGTIAGSLTANSLNWNFGGNVQIGANGTFSSAGTAVTVSSGVNGTSNFADNTLNFGTLNGTAANTFANIGTALAVGTVTLNMGAKAGGTVAGTVSTLSIGGSSASIIMQSSLNAIRSFSGDLSISSVGAMVFPASTSAVMSSGLGGTTVNSFGGTTILATGAVKIGNFVGSGVSIGGSGGVFIENSGPSGINIGGSHGESVKIATTAAFSANGTVATSITSLGPTGAGTTVKKWLTIVDATGSTCYIPCF